MGTLLLDLAAIVDGDAAAFAALPDLEPLEAWLDARDALLTAVTPALEEAVACGDAWPPEARTALSDGLAAVQAGADRISEALGDGKSVVSEELAALRRWNAYERYPVGSVPMHQRLDIRR